MRSITVAAARRLSSSTLPYLSMTSRELVCPKDRLDRLGIDAFGQQKGRRRSATPTRYAAIAKTEL